MWCIGISPNFEVRQTCVQVQTLPCTDQLSLGKSHRLSNPQSECVMRYSHLLVRRQGHPPTWAGHLPCVPFWEWKGEGPSSLHLRSFGSRALGGGSPAIQSNGSVIVSTSVPGQPGRPGAGHPLHALSRSCPPLEYQGSHSEMGHKP